MAAQRGAIPVEVLKSVTKDALLSNVRGQVTFRSASISGQTPFLFDEIEIARELRTTFDVPLSPRYMVPVDLRYDLSRNALRDATIGILRSYKVLLMGWFIRARAAICVLKCVKDSDDRSLMNRKDAKAQRNLRPLCVFAPLRSTIEYASPIFS
jgi:hypothetical protein